MKKEVNEEDITPPESSNTLHRACRLDPGPNCDGTKLDGKSHPVVFIDANICVQEEGGG